MMIKVSGLYYDYPGQRALDGVSFELPEQSITALVGPNGAGKTTLLRSMAALDEPMAGSIVVDGVNVWEQPREAHLRMGYLPDHFGLYQELTALQCLTYAAWTRGLRDKQVNEAIQWAIEQVGLAPQLHKLAGTLSRGQRQRLALAQAIVHRPKVLLMDEPASGLDPQARASLSLLMKSLAAQGMTLLISSHILAELETYCSAMLVLEQGRVLAYKAIHGDDPLSAVDQPMDINALTPSVARVLRIGLLDRQEAILKDLCQWLEARGLSARIEHGYIICEARFDSGRDQVELLQAMLSERWDVCEYAPHTESLQDVYMQTVANYKSKQE